MHINEVLVENFVNMIYDIIFQSKI